MNSCTQLSQKEMSACVCGGAKRGEPDQIGTIMGDAMFNYKPSKTVIGWGNALPRLQKSAIVALKA